MANHNLGIAHFVSDFLDREVYVIRVGVALTLKFTYQIIVLDDSDKSYQLVAEVPIPDLVDALHDMAFARAKELNPGVEVKQVNGFLFYSCLDPKSLCMN